MSASIAASFGGLDLGRDLDAHGALLLAPLGRRMSRLPPSWMSVPRPAMLVAMVTAPGTPASATIIGFLLVVAGVQHAVRDALAGLAVDLEVVGLQQLGQLLGLLDRDGADQDRLAATVAVGDLAERWPGSSRRRCGRPRRRRRCARPAGWSGSRARPSCRCRGIPGPRSRPCRSCPTACRRGGSSSGWSPRPGSGSRAGSSTPSLASMAWCRPSDRRRPCIMRPVNSSISITSPALTM